MSMMLLVPSFRVVTGFKLKPLPGKVQRTGGKKTQQHIAPDGRGLTCYDADLTLRFMAIASGFQGIHLCAFWETCKIGAVLSAEAVP